MVSFLVAVFALVALSTAIQCTQDLTVKQIVHVCGFARIIFEDRTSSGIP